MLPVIIAAAAAAAERRHLDALRVAGATAPARARPPEELGLARDDAFARLAKRGVLREAGNGAVYLDEAALIAHRDRRPPRAVVVLLLAGLLIMAGLLLFLLHSRGQPA